MIVLYASHCDTLPVTFITRMNTFTYEDWFEMLFSPGSDEIYKESLAMHAKHHGKLEIRSKVPIRNKHDLSLAYTREWQKYAGR